MTTQSRSFFDTSTPERKVALLPAQYDPSTPSVDGLDRATNLLIPDYLTSSRLDHFPSDLYDLRPHSHLVRFMRALLGDSGLGSMRKRWMIARFQQAFTSTHFYDVDRFYGAIFGVNRMQGERLPFNPLTGMATGDEWDRVHASDAQFRERVFALAKAIPLGATRPGLRTAAEAVVGAPCEVIEDWQRIDWLHSHGYSTDEDYLGRTYVQIERLGTYDDLEAQGTWNDLTGVETTALHTARLWRDFAADGFGTYALAEGAPDYTFLEQRTINLGRAVNDRGGVLVRPLKVYADSEGGRAERAQDEQGLRRVLNVLKPAGVRLRLDMSADGLYEPRPLTAVYADSEYYEIVQTVSPANSPHAALYPLSTGQRRAGMTVSSSRVVPRPPFSATQGAEWNYANEVVAVRSYAEHPLTHVVTDGNDFDRVTDIYGHVTEFSGEKGVLDPRQAEAGRLSSDVSLMSHPYAADRPRVLPHA